MLYPILSEYTGFDGDNHLLWFTSEVPFLGKFCPKIQKCLFKLKFDAFTNSNKQNLMVMSSFSFLILFLGKYKTKSQNYLLEIRFDALNNSNMLMAMMLMAFLFWTENTYFG